MPTRVRRSFFSKCVLVIGLSVVTTILASAAAPFIGNQIYRGQSNPQWRRAPTTLPVMWCRATSRRSIFAGYISSRVRPVIRINNVGSRTVMMPVMENVFAKLPARPVPALWGFSESTIAPRTVLGVVVLGWPFEFMSVHVVLHESNRAPVPSDVTLRALVVHCADRVKFGTIHADRFLVNVFAYFVIIGSVLFILDFAVRCVRLCSGLCPWCRYPMLTGGNGICPECGRTCTGRSR